jgi:acetyl esterase/lipase
MASQEANGPSGPTFLCPTLPVFTRISYFFRLYGFKFLAETLFLIQRFRQSQPVSQKPTLTKSYPCRHRLESRIFIPREHKNGELLPLYIDIHGGGFAICDPRHDDEFCSTFANRFNVLVVSINYSKTPSVAFPVPTHDVAAIARAVIEDDTLPVDPSRVAIGGFSAGGNLSASAVQLPALKTMIEAVVLIYPVLDFSIPPEQKQAVWHKPGEKDRLIGIAKILDYGYIPSGQDLRDPLLSPSFARKEDLPEFVFCLGAEDDMLANEARAFMCKLAGIDELTEAEKYEFERGSYKWKMARGKGHGFTHKQIGKEEDEQKRVESLNEAVGEIGEWLFRGPFGR